MGKYPLVSVHALTRTGSDHTPLLIDTRNQNFLGNKARISFELSWLRKMGFYDLVAREWSSCVDSGSPIEKWQNKIRHLRQFLRGRAKNLSGEFKKRKKIFSYLLMN